MADITTQPSGLAALLNKEKQIGADPVGNQLDATTTNTTTAADGQTIPPADPNLNPPPKADKDPEPKTGPAPGTELFQQPDVDSRPTSATPQQGVMRQTETPMEYTARSPFDYAESPFEQQVEDETLYTYRHKSIRNYAIGSFEFVNHLLVVRGEKQNEIFKQLMGSTPPSERLQVVEYHPEVLSELEKPVDYRPGAIVRGAQSVSRINDAKTNPGGLSGAGTALDALRAQRSTT